MGYGLALRYRIMGYRMNFKKEIKQLLNRVEELKKLSPEVLANSQDLKDIIEVHINNLIIFHSLLRDSFFERIQYYSFSDDKSCKIKNTIVKIEKIFNEAYRLTDMNKIEKLIKNGCDTSLCRAVEFKNFITKNFKDEYYKLDIFKDNTDSFKRLLEDKVTLVAGTNIREFFENVLDYFADLKVFFIYAIALGYIQEEIFTIDFFDDLNPLLYNLRKELINIPVSLYVRQFKMLQKGQGERLSKDNVLGILDATEIVLMEFEKIIIAESKSLESLPSTNFTLQEKKIIEQIDNIKRGDILPLETIINEAKIKVTSRCKNNEELRNKRKHNAQNFISDFRKKYKSMGKDLNLGRYSKKDEGYPVL